MIVPQPTDEAELLRRRAARYARTPPAAPVQVDPRSTLIFRLGTELFGIEAAYVRVAVRYSEPEPIPGAPPFLIGVCQLRGDVLPLVDLRLFLEMAGGGLNDNAWMIVLGAGRAEFGVLADAVLQVRTIDVGSLAPIQRFGGDEPLLLGSAPGPVTLIDAAGLMRSRRLFLEGDAA
ncbi:MAG: chemotaxis protein CheW [Planctomycetia bacterium]